MEHTTKTISSEENGMRLDRCLRLWIPKLPQSLIEKAARKGFLKVNGTKAKPSLRLEEGQVVSFPESFRNLDLETPQKKISYLNACRPKVAQKPYSFSRCQHHRS